MQEDLVGRVGAYYPLRGFGFLVQSGGKNDSFFHRYEVTGDDPRAGEVIVIVMIKVALTILMITLISYGLPPLPPTHRGML